MSIAAVAALLVASYDRVDLQGQVAQAAQASTCSAADSATPDGQSTPSQSGDPLIPTYCVPAPAPQAPTFKSGANDWVDSFGVNGVARFNDGDMGYRVWDSLDGIQRSQHLVVGDHWIDDNKLPFSGGAMIRPNRNFHFENGKLVVEGDFSSPAVFGGDNWAEFVVTTADHPDINTPDQPEQEYAYGHFKGFPTFGCRLQASGENTCAAFTGSTLSFPPTQDKAPCFSLSPDRLWELSFFQSCGDNFGGTHFGGFPDQARSVWRSCQSNEDYDTCLDRFRFELTKHGMVLYVNGIRYFEDSGWDDAHSLPDGLVNGTVYVYWADWDFAGQNQGRVDRFHWERLAVNPHNPDGSLAGPSASPTYCPNQPRFTCSSGDSGGGQPTPTPTPHSATPTPTPVPVGGSSVVAFDDLPNPNRTLAGQYPSGVIDWGNGPWWLSGPYGGDGTQSVSFNGAGPTSASIRFLTARQLASLDAINGGTVTSTVTLSCSGMPTVRASVPAGQAVTIRTGWSGTCGTLTIGSSNGWDTNFDNLALTTGGAAASSNTASVTRAPSSGKAAAPAPAPAPARGAKTKP